MPPPFRCVRVSYSVSGLKVRSHALLHTDNACAGRGFCFSKIKHLILPLAAVVPLFFVSCDKTGDRPAGTDAQGSETFDNYFGDSADNGFFSKQSSIGFLTDTAWVW